MAKAEVEVGVKQNAFRRGLDEMRAQSESWANDLKGTIAGAFALGAVTSFVQNFVTEMARVKDLSDRLGESSDTIQRVGQAAALSGTDLEGIIKTLNKLTLEAAKSAESFAEIGINAADFLNSGPEEKLIMLAKAYEACNEDQAKMLKLMELLGGKGQDMLILLSGGVAGVKDALEDTRVVSESVISAVARLDDGIAIFTQKAQQSLGSIIGLLMHLGAAVGAVYQSFAKGGSIGENYQKNIDQLLDQKPTAQSQKKDVSTVADQAKTAADEKKKADDAAKALAEEMVNLARSRMTDEQKIVDLKKEEAQLTAAAKDAGKSEREKLEAARELLKVVQEREALEKSVAQTAAKEKEKAEAKEKKRQEDIAKAEGDLSKEENKQRLEKMGPAERIKELQRQQAQLYSEAEKAKNSGDAKGAAEKKLEGLKLNDEIARAQKELKDKADKAAPTVVASSLASIGGGGNFFMTQGMDPALQESRKHTSLLEQIARNTGGGSMEGGSLTSPF